MATVYLCEELKHDRQVALKLLKPELAAVLGAERFVQEIKTTAALQHPHVLPLFLDELVAVPIAVRRTRIDARFCAAPTRCEGIRELLATQSRVKLFWTAQALRDRTEIWDHISAENHGAAARMDTRFSAAAAKLRAHPRLDRPGRRLGACLGAHRAAVAAGA